LLIRAGIDVNAKDRDSKTALEIAETKKAGMAETEKYLAALLECLRNPASFEEQTNAWILQMEKAEAEAREAKNSDRTMPGESFAVKAISYSRAGTSLTLDVKREGSSALTCDIELDEVNDEMLLPVRFASNGIPVPWDFLYSVWSNFFERKHNFDSEQQLFSKDDENFYVRIFATVRCNEKDYSGENKWKGVLLTLPLKKE
jgi:hypothetical protein